MFPLTENDHLGFCSSGCPTGGSTAVIELSKSKAPKMPYIKEMFTGQERDVHEEDLDDPGATSEPLNTAHLLVL